MGALRYPHYHLALSEGVIAWLPSEGALGPKCSATACWVHRFSIQNQIPVPKDIPAAVSCRDLRTSGIEVGSAHLQVSRLPYGCWQ